MVEEVTRIGESCVAVFFILCHELLFPWVIVVVISSLGIRVTVVKDYNFINAEHGESSGNGADDSGFEVMSLCAVSLTVLANCETLQGVR